MPEATWKKGFLAALKETGNVTAACRAANVKRTTAYAAKATSEHFAECWESALEEATDDLEREARRRAIEGVKKGVYHNGELVATELQYSDTLLIFLMKGHRPEKYRDRHEVKHAGSIEVRSLADIAKEVSNEEKAD